MDHPGHVSIVWLTKFWETVHNDSNRRPGTLVETFATGQANTTTFLVTKRAVTYEKGGVVMGSDNPAAGEAGGRGAGVTCRPRGSRSSSAAW